MTKRSVIRCCLTLLMVLYLFIAMQYTHRASAADKFRDIEIVVNDPGRRGFVTGDDIDRELGMLSLRIKDIRHDSLNTRRLEREICSMDKIETANCVIRNDGSLLIEASPLEPLARVFDENGENYYINRAGKRMSAGPQYHTDVPVVSGRFHEKGINPSYVLPLVDYINAHPGLEGFISAIYVDKRTDILLIPSVSGQVISFGDTSDIADKFSRLEAFYRQVLPVRGWNLYDTISVKWRGQIVARRCTRRHVTPPITTEEFHDVDDLSTMLTTADGNDVITIN